MPSYATQPGPGLGQSGKGTHRPPRPFVRNNSEQGPQLQPNHSNGQANGNGARLNHTETANSPGGYRTSQKPEGSGSSTGLPLIEEPLNNPRFNQLCHFFNTSQGCKYGNDCGYMHKVIKKNVTVCHFFGSPRGCQAPSCGFVHNVSLYNQ
jgi:hypothetical protein